MAKMIMVMKAVMMALLMLCLGCISMQAKAQCSSDDKDTLLLVKEYLGVPPSLSSWKASTDCNFRGWDGVEGSEGHPTSLTLRSLSDVKQGVIYPGIGRLTSLRYLYIDQIPGLEGEIPDSVGNLVNLLVFEIRFTGLSGRIPPSITQLNKLEILSLNDNQLTGPIPSLMTQSELIYLELHNNQLNGPLPPSLGQLPSLIFLTAANNRLSGRIPTSLPARLQILSLKSNQLSGKIPESFAGRNRLRVLELSYNQLEGQIPAGISSFGVSDFYHNKCLCGLPFRPCPCCECPIVQTYVTTM